MADVGRTGSDSAFVLDDGGKLVGDQHDQSQADFRREIINASAHELSTPITPIRLQVYMLRAGTHGPLNPKQSSSLKIIERNLERLEGILKEMLDVARLETKHVPIRFALVNASALADEAAESYREPLRLAGLDPKTEIQPAVAIFADPQRLPQVLFNFLNNALKFTPAGGHVRVFVKVRERFRSPLQSWFRKTLNPSRESRRTMTSRPASAVSFETHPAAVSFRLP